MYKTIIMPVDVFEMELSDKAVRHAEFLAQDDGVIHLLHVLPGSASLSLHRFAADVRRFEEHLQHEAEERLQTMVSHFTIDPSRIKQHVRLVACGMKSMSWQKNWGLMLSLSVRATHRFRPIC